ncbi:hypothetical protein KKA13_03615 [Patescibacteria group bacterium]|nr:hypothetical protein [Patescibacteria group bacterium]MBU1613254.1 hypothetical protein [Patescibacteria group bacterium]
MVELRNNKKIITAVSIIIVLLVAGTGFFVWKSKAQPKGYQAVFLSNGQVYFGKATDKDSKYVKMTNIYYLQLKQPLQSQNLDTLNQTDLALIKLGNELHGPTDRMEINRDHILFIEDLRPDSKVAQAIEKYSAK